MTVQRLLLLLTMGASLAACQPGKIPIGNPESPYPPAHEPQVGDILHLPTGIYVDQATLIDQASRAQIVYVGETHDNPASHQLQATILRALEKRNPGQVSLAMEMFTPSQQPVLDLWTAGKLSEKEFLKQVDWFGNWRMNYALYKPLLDLAKEKHIPVVALNADKKLDAEVSHSPLEALSEEERNRLPEMQADPYQVAATRAFYGGHVQGKAALAGFERVQTLWDESMAEHLANYLKSDAGRGRQVMVAAGGNHIQFGYGIPRRVFRRIPASYLLVGSREIEIPADQQQRLMDVDMPRFPMPSYDFVQFTRYEKLAEPGVKLGIMIKKADGGIQVLDVIPDSLAEKSGLLKDDLLTEIDGVPLTDIFDLIYELQHKSVGDTLSLKLVRDGQEMNMSIKVTEKAPKHGMSMQHGKK